MKSSHEWYNVADLRGSIGADGWYIAHGRIDGTDYMDSWEVRHNEETGAFWHNDAIAGNRQVFDVNWITPYPKFNESQVSPHELMFSIGRLALLMMNHISDVDAHEEGAEHLKKVMAFVKEAIAKDKNQ
jgi:hypothetical protein